jgi:hypothetical protein
MSQRATAIESALRALVDWTFGQTAPLLPLVEQARAALGMVEERPSRVDVPYVSVAEAVGERVASSATWNRDLDGDYAHVDALWLQVKGNPEDGWLVLVVDAQGEQLAEEYVDTSLADAKAAAVRLALDVLDEMRRAVEGLT